MEGCTRAPYNTWASAREESNNRAFNSRSVNLSTASRKRAGAFRRGLRRPTGIAEQVQMGRCRVWKGRLTMDDRRWSISFGLWYVVHGLWSVLPHINRIGNNPRLVTNGFRKLRQIKLDAINSLLTDGEFLA